MRVTLRVTDIWHLGYSRWANLLAQEKCMPAPKPPMQCVDFKLFLIVEADSLAGASWRSELGWDTPSRYVAIGWNTCKLLLLLV